MKRNNKNHVFFNHYSEHFFMYIQFNILFLINMLMNLWKPVKGQVFSPVTMVSLNNKTDHHHITTKIFIHYWKSGTDNTHHTNHPQWWVWLIVYLLLKLCCLPSVTISSTKNLATTLAQYNWNIASYPLYLQNSIWIKMKKV